MANNLLQNSGGKNLLRQGSDVSKSRGILRSVGQGVSFGFSDEITAVLVAATAAATGDDFSDVYKDVIFNERGEQKEFEQENPGLSLAAEVGGSLMLGGTSAGRALFRKPLAGGAATGAAFGAGKSEKSVDDAGLIGDVATGATIGAATGKGVDLALRGANKIIQTRAGRIIKRTINRQDLDNTQIADKVRELGPDARLLDAIPELGESIAQIPAARPILEEFLETRAGGQQARIVGSLSNLAKSTKQYWDNIFELDAKRATEAAPLYKQAFEEGVVFNDVLKDLVVKIKGAFPGAIKSGKRIAKATGTDLPNKSKLGLEQLDLLKQGLDDEISKSFRAGGGKIAREGIRLKNELVEELDRQNPIYKEARNAWAGPSAIKDAQEKGRKVLRTDFELSARDVKNMTDGEREGFVMGAVRAVRDKILTKNIDKNSVKSFTPMLRERLKPVFKDNDSFEAFIKVLNSEDTFSAVRNQVLAGSATAKRTIGAQDLAVPAIFASQGRPVLAASELARKLLGNKKLSDSTARDVADILTNEGVDPTRITKVLLGKGLSEKAVKSIISSVTLATESQTTREN